MNPPKVRWTKVRPGLYYCYIGDEKIYSHLFLEVRDGLGNLYEHWEYNLYWIPGIMALKRAKNYVKFHIQHKWMEENQREWTRNRGTNK